MSRRILPQRGYRGAPRVSTRVSTLGLNFWIAKVGLEEDAAFFVVLVLPRRRTRARHRRARGRVGFFPVVRAKFPPLALSALSSVLSDDDEDDDEHE